jgi:hypothetical protein
MAPDEAFLNMNSRAVSKSSLQTHTRFERQHLIWSTATKPRITDENVVFAKHIGAHSTVALALDPVRELKCSHPLHDACMYYGS